MTHLDDLLRLAAENPPIPPAFVPGILQRVREDQERRGVMRLFSSSLFAAIALILTIDLSSRMFLELIGRKWLDLLGGFYEEPILLLSREGWMAVTEHLLKGNIPFFVPAAVFCGLLIWHLRRVYAALPSHTHALRPTP